MNCHLTDFGRPVDYDGIKAPPADLGTFLKSRRHRIDPGVGALGTYERTAVRRGRRVTQEELAEAIDSSRVWYAMLESGATLRTSPQLLDRLSQALMLDADERAELFSLAIPELKRTEPRPACKAFLRGYSLINSLSRRLWAASSESEALTEAAEQLAAWFDDADAISYTRRTDHVGPRFQCGVWEAPLVVDPGYSSRWDAACRDFAASLQPEQIDELLLLPTLAEPGDVATFEEAYQGSPLRRVVTETWARQGISEVMGTFISARVRSRRGLIGSIVATHKTRRPYSASDRAAIATLAEVTSLALS